MDRGRGRRDGGRGAGRPRREDKRGEAQRYPRRGKAEPKKSSAKTTLPRGVEEEIRSTARGFRGAEAAALLEQAVRDLERGRPEPAARTAGRAKELAPRSASVREVLGMALYRLERFREALRELQAYRRMSGRRDQNHLLADAQRALGSPEKAVELVQEALRAQLPEEVRVESAIVGGAALADLGRFDEALSLLRRHRTDPDVARPHDLRLWYALGDVLQRAGRSREAATEFRRILRHDPAAFDTAERLAAIDSA